MPLEQPAGYLDYHLHDPVVNLTHLGDFAVGETRWALSQSNNNVDVAADILLSCPSVPSARIRLDESQYRPPPVFRRELVGHTSQPFRSSISANSVPVQ
jgi:hypothetical protein